MPHTTNPWLDISVPLTTGMVHWPGDPEPTFQRCAEANVTLCRMTAHSGTHMDAPCHFLATGEGMEAFPLSLGIGPARVLHVPETATITKADLVRKNILPGERILLRTRNALRSWHSADFQPDFAALEAAAARYLVDCGIGLLGVDYLSVGAYESDGAETHRILRGGGVWIVEGLQLGQISEGSYDLICLPLNIHGSDGAPARVVLRKAEY
jgi:arylformamidase